MGIRSITRLFEKHSVMVSGEKGSGKDVLFGNVIARRKKPYVSNMNYTLDKNYQLLDFKKLDCGGNTYKNLILGNYFYYEYPYIMGSDIYVSDSGIYLPSQYNNELNKMFPEFPTFMALSRHLGDCRVHVNSQEMKRPWDKVREQSENYIRCNWCFVLFGVVLQKVTYYDKYESALARIRPCRVRRNSLFNAQANIQADIYRDNFFNQHGIVKSYILIYLNKSKHDDKAFRKLFKEGIKK